MTPDVRVTLDDIYLDDSWILNVTVQPERLDILVDFVIVASSPHYSEPKPNEYYCYKRGMIAFEKWSDLQWDRGTYRYGVDPDGEIDYDSFYEFSVKQNHYTICGGFGDMIFDANSVTITLAEDAQAIVVDRHGKNGGQEE